MANDELARVVAEMRRESSEYMKAAERAQSVSAASIYAGIGILLANYADSVSDAAKRDEHANAS